MSVVAKWRAGWWLAAGCMVAVCGPAQALQVTNLDHKRHLVRFESAGSAQERCIEPGDTEYFTGQPNGLLTLVGVPEKRGSDLNTDGILAGFTGGGRTDRLPAETRDSFVIWPDGELNLQQRRRGDRHSF